VGYQAVEFFNQGLEGLQHCAEAVRHMQLGGFLQSK
jgi:hypothetical protein